MQPQKTLRFTFRVTGGQVQVESVERVDMITPPSIGERPQPQRHAGFWMEVQDEEKTPLFHRTLDSPMANSVEVHRPDGSIGRVFGPPRDAIFEVLVPDDPSAADVVLMGRPVPTSGDLTAAADDEGTRELARFAIPKEEAE